MLNQHSKEKIHSTLLTLIFVGVFYAATLVTSYAQMVDEVFLPHTDHELHVYRVMGEEPGKTLMIIGGIQGDEPSGYITADLYADIHLKKGNLIVVPRANFYSILLNRREGKTGDMNRKFSPDPDKKRINHLEEEVVSVLKHLIAESDALLNLHEGSGYYNPAWVNSMENPGRYGQSLIFDAAEYSPPYGRQKIELENVAIRIVDRVNKQISEKRFHFKPNNHNTLSADSSHKEQRESATYYALTRAHIPAFGVETSKMIKSLKTKISLHKLVINSTMDEMGIVRDSPGGIIDEPKLDYLVVKVNDSHPYAMKNGTTLELEAGDNVVVADILANYSRGLVADVENFGATNDTGRPFRFTNQNRIVVRKDSVICGWVNLKAKEKSDKLLGTVAAKKAIPVSKLTAESISIDIDGVIKSIANMQTMVLPRKGRLILQGIRTNIARLDNDVMVNFKGFAPPKSVNDGNDILYPIYLQHDLLARYSVDSNGKRYPIIANYKDKPIGHFWVELQ